MIVLAMRSVAAHFADCEQALIRTAGVLRSLFPGIRCDRENRRRRVYRDDRWLRGVSGTSASPPHERCGGRQSRDCGGTETSPQSWLSPTIIQQRKCRELLTT